MRKSIFKSYFVLLIITLVIRILDVAKSLIVASKIGVSGSADVFFALQQVPEYIVILIGIDTLKGVANSEYSSLFSSGNLKELKKSLSYLFKILSVVSVIVVIVLFALRKQVIQIILPGLSENTFSLALTLSVFVFPAFFVRSLSSLLQPYYNSNKKFYFPVISQSVITIAIIISVYLPFMHNMLIYNLGLAFLTGNFLYLMFLLIPLFGKEKLYMFKGLRIDPVSLRIIKSCGAILLLSFINQIYLFSRNYFASFYPEGSISALNYGASIPTFVATLTFTIVFGVLLTNLSSYFAENNIKDAKKIFYDTLNILVFIYVPIVAFFIIFSDKILAMVYLRGNFDLNGIAMSKLPFIWESLALMSFLTYIIPTSLFLAKKEYKFLTYTGSVSYLAGIGLSYIFTKYFGFYGVSISAFTVSGIYGLLLFIRIWKIFPDSFGEIFRSFKLLLCGLVTAVIMYYLNIFSGNFITVRYELVPLIEFLFVTFAISTGIYLMLAYFTEPNLFKKVINLIGDKLKNNKFNIFRKK